MVHWSCIWNSQATIFLNHCWYIVLLKTVINLSCRDKIIRTLKVSPQFNLIDTTYSSQFHADLWGGGGRVLTKLKQCKQATGPKSVVPGAEIHRTRPSYHVIIVNRMSIGLKLVMKWCITYYARTNIDRIMIYELKFASCSKDISWNFIGIYNISQTWESARVIFLCFFACFFRFSTTIFSLFPSGLLH